MNQEHSISFGIMGSISLTLKEVNVISEEGDTRNQSSHLPFEVLDKKSNLPISLQQRPVCWQDGHFCKLMSSKNKILLRNNIKIYHERQQKIIESGDNEMVKNSIIGALAKDNQKMKKYLKKQISTYRKGVNLSERKISGRQFQQVQSNITELRQSQFSPSQILPSPKRVSQMDEIKENEYEIGIGQQQPNSNSSGIRINSQGEQQSLIRQAETNRIELLFCVSYQGETQNNFIEFLQRLGQIILKLISRTHKIQNTYTQESIAIALIYNDTKNIPNFIREIQQLEENLDVNENEILMIQQNIILSFSIWLPIFSFFTKHKLDPMRLQKFVYSGICQHFDPKLVFFTDFNHVPDLQGLYQQIDILEYEQKAGVYGRYRPIETQTQSCIEMSLRSRDGLIIWTLVDASIVWIFIQVNDNKLYQRWSKVKEQMFKIFNNQENLIKNYNTLKIQNINQDYMGLLFLQMLQDYSKPYSRSQLSYVGNWTGEVIRNKTDLRSIFDQYRKLNNYQYSSSVIIAKSLSSMIQLSQSGKLLMFFGSSPIWIYHYVLAVEKYFKLSIIIFIVHFSSQKFSDEMQEYYPNVKYIYIPQQILFALVLTIALVFTLMMQIRLTDNLYIPTIRYSGSLGLIFYPSTQNRESVSETKLYQGFQHLTNDTVNMKFMPKTEYQKIDETSSLLTIRLIKESIPRRSFKAKELIKCNKDLREPFHYLQPVRLTFKEEINYGLTDIVQPYIYVLQAINFVSFFMYGYTIIFFYLQDSVFYETTFIALIVMGSTYLLLLMQNYKIIVQLIIDTLALTVNYMTNQVVLQTYSFMNMDVDSNDQCVSDIYHEQIVFGGTWIALNSVLSFSLVSIGQYLDKRGYLLLAISCCIVALFSLKVICTSLQVFCTILQNCLLKRKNLNKVRSQQKSIIEVREVDLHVRLLEQNQSQIMQSECIKKVLRNSQEIIKISQGPKKVNFQHIKRDSDPRILYINSQPSEQSIQQQQQSEDLKNITIFDQADGPNLQEQAFPMSKNNSQFLRIFPQIPTLLSPQNIAQLNQPINTIIDESQFTMKSRFSNNLGSPLSSSDYHMPKREFQQAAQTQNIKQLIQDDKKLDDKCISMNLINHENTHKMKTRVNTQKVEQKFLGSDSDLQ